MTPEMILVKLHDKFSSRFPCACTGTLVMTISDKVVLDIYPCEGDSIIIDHLENDQRFGLVMITPNKFPKFLLYPMLKKVYNEEAKVVKEVYTYIQKLMKDNSIRFIEE